MASSEPMMDLAKEPMEGLEECTICTEVKRLHLLPCAHRCCQQCISNIKGGGPTVKCPMCRKESAMPAEDSPDNRIPAEVSPGEELLKLSLNEKNEWNDIKQDNAAVNDNKVHHCFNCKNDVEVFCGACQPFMCLRCQVWSNCESESAGRHVVDVLEKAAEESVLRLKMWQAATKSRIQLLERSIEMRHETITADKREIEERKTALKTADMIDSSLNPMQKIGLIKQICETSSTTSSLSLPASQPTSLQLISQFETRSQCATVDYHSVTGDLLIGCSDGMKILRGDSYEVMDVTDHRRAKVVEHGGDVFISYKEDEVVKVIRYDMDSKTSELLFSFSMKSTYSSYLTVSDKFVASINQDDDTIVLYNRASSNKSKIKPPGVTVIGNLHFHPDNSLLVTCVHNGKPQLNKYRIVESSSETLELVWSSPKLPDAYGIAVADNGLVLVSGARNKIIYILSSEGARVAELSSERLSDNYVDISIRGDILAVAGFNTKSVLLFKII